MFRFIFAAKVTICNNFRLKGCSPTRQNEKFPRSRGMVQLSCQRHHNPEYMLRILICLALLNCFSAALGQGKVTLNGYVKDAGDGEELLGVTIYIPSLKAGTITNDYGFYALTVPKGNYEVQFTYIGYKQEVRTL